MSPLIYIGLFIMLVTIVSEVVFVFNYIYIRFIKRHPVKIQKKLFITFGIMLCGFFVFLLGTQKVFSSKEVSSFEITMQNTDETVVDNGNEILPIDNTEQPTIQDIPWYDTILSQENKDSINQFLNDTGEVVDNVITTIGEGISQIFE